MVRHLRGRILFERESHRGSIRLDKWYVYTIKHYLLGWSYLAQESLLLISSQTFATFGSSGFNVLRDCFSQNEVISEGSKITTKQVNTLRPRGDSQDDFPLLKFIFGNNEGGSEIECECILVGLANVENWGLDEAGVNYELGKGIVLNDLLQSISNKDIFGVDMSGEMAKVVVQNSLFDDDWKLSNLVVPRAACDCRLLCGRCCLQGFHSRH